MVITLSFCARAIGVRGDCRGRLRTSARIAGEDTHLTAEPKQVGVAIDAIARDSAVKLIRVYLRDPEEPVLRLVGWRGGPPPDREVGWEKGLVGGAAAAGIPLQSQETGDVTLAVPILLGEDALGVLAVGGRTGREWTPDEEDALVARGRALARDLAPPPLHALRAELGRRVQPAALAWLDTVIAAAQRGEPSAIVNGFPAVGRRVGREPLECRSALVVREVGLEVPLRAWRVDDAARVAFLCAFTGNAEALARELYYTGDLRERCGALRALAVVGREAAAHDAILDAARTSAVELFEAAIADNPYTSRVLPIDEFRTVVLKCAFVGVSIDRVIGLEARADAELSRMLLSYVSEREVAGRSVPPDVWPVVALHPTPGLVAKLCGYLEHPAEAHRAGAAVALGRIDDPRVRPFIEDRVPRETDRAVRRALERALA